MASTLLAPLHVRYITALASHTSSLTYHLTTHLRINAIYWALTALHLLRAPDALPRDDVIAYVLQCWDDEQGAFGSHPGHDAHILATLSAVQILFMYGDDALAAHLGTGSEEARRRRERLVGYILALQDPVTGAFAGDTTRLEYDSRFLYCAVAALALLSSVPGAADSGSRDIEDAASSGSGSGSGGDSNIPRDPLTRIDEEKTIHAVLACRNFDGGFGTGQGAESHAGQAFVCVGALRILNAVPRLGKQGRRRLEVWLSERQLPNGGLNGRPQKLEDVCYSWWVMSALAMLGKLHWVNGDKLARFILSAQDPDNGGIADRPDNVADVFHTLFGIAGLGMLGKGTTPEGSATLGNVHIDEVDPVYCLPVKCLDRAPHLRRPYQSFAQGTTVQQDT